MGGCKHTHTCDTLPRLPAEQRLGVAALQSLLLLFFFSVFLHECKASQPACAHEESVRVLPQAYAMLCNVCLHVGEPMEARLLGTMEEARELGTENAGAQMRFITVLFLAFS